MLDMPSPVYTIKYVPREGSALYTSNTRAAERDTLSPGHPYPFM